MFKTERIFIHADLLRSRLVQIKKKKDARELIRERTTMKKRKKETCIDDVCISPRTYSIYYRDYTIARYRILQLSNDSYIVHSFFYARIAKSCSPSRVKLDDETGDVLFVAGTVPSRRK